MFWALWDTASFCVDNRLRTPLGSNKNTLGSINRAIGHFERQLSAKKVEDTKESTQILLSRPRMLIFFIQNLEKLIFNAYEGRGLSLPAASKQVRTFNNRRTCQMWLRGLRAKFRKSLSKFKSTSALFPSAIGRGRMASWLQMLSALNQAQSSILKTLQLYEEQSNDETGKSFLDQLPERTWRWPLTKQRADVELLMLKNTRQTNTHAKVDKLDEIGRSMILEEGDVWPCNLNRDGIAILHGASLLKTNPSKFEPS